MEGLGQWAIFAWHRDPRGGGFDRETALREVRRGGRWWSQDQWLGLFLVIDRLVPGWQKLAFAPQPETAEALLARAAGTKASERPSRHSSFQRKLESPFSFLPAPKGK